MRRRMKRRKGVVEADVSIAPEGRLNSQLPCPRPCGVPRIRPAPASGGMAERVLTHRKRR